MVPFYTQILTLQIRFNFHHSMIVAASLPLNFFTLIPACRQTLHPHHIAPPSREIHTNLIWRCVHKKAWEGTDLIVVIIAKHIESYMRKRKVPLTHFIEHT